MIIDISICTFNNGGFDVMFKNKETGEELVFSGERKVTDAELERIDEIAPACVWTTYQRVTAND